MKIGFVTDSNADIPDAWAKKHGIKTIPNVVIIGEESFLDGVEITREAYYEKLPTLNPPPTTAAPAPAVYEEVYKEMFDSGVEFIFSVHTPAKISNIFNVATLAANNFPEKVEVIDSLFFSMGLGFQVIAGAEAAKAGKSVDEVREAMADTRRRTKLFAMLNTLENLKRSGRVSWIKAGLGELLQLKMIVEVKNGEIERLAAVRTWKKGLNRFQEIFESLGRLERLAILDAGAKEEARAFFGRLVAKGLADEPVFESVATAIGTHTGVNAIGFAAVLRE